MEDVNISKFRAQVVRSGSTPASPGFVVSEGQNPVDPSGSGQNHLPVTIATASTGLSITDAQVLGGAGTVGQYIRGDGSLADFPATTGGGSSVSYYLNGSVSQGTIGGVAYKELNRAPVFGAGTDITINADGYIASFITDALDPNKLLIPAGNWNFETYFSANSSGGSPSFYIELYKYNGTTFTLIATSSSAPELIAFGTSLNPYFSTLAVPETVLALTDRLALRYYVTHSGRTITLHTENGHLCEVITTFTTGLTALNGLTNQVQFFAVGISGTDFAISSATDTHTFNLPTASATNRGALSSADWTTFNGKQNALNGTGFVKISGTTISYDNTSYLPLIGGTLTGPLNGTSIILSGDITANRYRGVNSLVLNTYTTVNPASNVYLYSPGNDRDAWVYLDSADTGSNWGIYHRQIDTTVSGLPGNSIGFIGGGTNTLQAWISLANGDGYFKGDLTANNLSGTNTGNVTIGTANGLSLSTQVLSLGLASAGVTGALSGTDWSTFNSKQNALTNPVTGTGTSGQVAYFNGTSSITGESNLFWDATNDRLGIGTNIPAFTLSVVGNVSATVVAAFQNTSSLGYSGAQFLNNSGSPMGHVGYANASTGATLQDVIFFGSIASKSVLFTTADTIKMALFANGNLGLGVGTTDAGFKLDVNGTGRFSGELNALQLNTRSASGSAALLLKDNSSNNKWEIGHVSNSLYFYNYTTGTNPLVITGSTGAATFSSSVGINGVAASYPLYVRTGTNQRARFVDNGGIFQFGVLNDAETNYSDLSLGNSVVVIKSGGDIILNNGSASTPTSTATPNNIRFNNNYSSGYTDASLKIYLFNQGSTRQGFTSGPAYDLQYHSSGDASGKHVFYVANNPIMTVNNLNVLVGTQTDSGDKLRVNGNSFSNTIMTWNPQNDNRSGVAWRLGSASILTVIPNRALRVNVGGVEYYIGAIEV